MDILHNTKSHPTASYIYEEARKTIPNISLGTVYRNLAELDAQGSIISLKVKNGGDRFDGNAAPHVHLYCNSCERVIDLEIPFTDNFIESCSETTNAEIDSHSIILFGKCPDCCK